MTLRQAQLLAMADVLRGASVHVTNRSGMALADVTVTDVQRREDTLEVSCGPSPIVASGYVAEASLRGADGSLIHQFTYGEDLQFDSDTFVRGDRVSLTLMGV